MNQQKTPLWRKYGKTVFKLLDRETIRTIPLIVEERKRDKFSAEGITKRVIKAAVGRERTIEEERMRTREGSTDREREKEPTSQTIIRRMKRVRDVGVLEERVRTVLREQFYRLKRKLKGKTICLAVDAHDEPYYGKKHYWTCGGRRKQSTTTFVRVVALYLVHPGRPILLDVRRMDQSEGHTALMMITALLQWLEDKRYSFRRIILLGDGKYCYVPLLSFLSANNIDFIVRAYPSRVSKTLGSELQRHNMLYRGKSYRHTLYSRLSGYFSTREIVYLDDDGINVYATSLSSSISRVVNLFRRRFRIENAFRDMRFLLLRTCSRDPRVRYTLLFLAFLLHHFLHYLLALTFSPSFFVLHRFIPCPFRQRLFFSALSSFFERSLSPSCGGDH